MKKIFNRHKKLLTLFLTLFFVFNISIDCFARESAYLATFYDDSTNQWKSSVILSSREVEREFITGKFFGGPALEYVNDPRSFDNFTYTYDLTGSSAGNIKVSVFWNDDIGTLGFKVSDGAQAYNIDKLNDLSYDDRKLTTSAPLTFPSNHFDASEADINRAYSISSTLTNSLNDAIVFLNGGESFDAGEEDKFKETTQLLLCSNGTSNTNVARVNNPNNNCTYEIYYGVYLCAIRCASVGTSQSGLGWNYFPYKLNKGYLYQDASIVSNKMLKADIANLRKTRYSQVMNRSSIFCFNKNDADTANNKYWARDIQAYIRKQMEGKKEGNLLDFTNGSLTDKRVFSTETTNSSIGNKDDGTTNYQKMSGYYCQDAEYISWFQMVYEAKLLEAQGIVYSTQGDLLEVSGAESKITHFIRKLLNGIVEILGCYNMNQLVFNEGIRGTMAFYHGIFYTNWYSGVTMLYLISATISVAILTISVVLAINRRGLDTLSSTPFARYNLMQSFKDIIFCGVLIAITLPLADLVFGLGDSFINIFKELKGTTRLRALTSVSNTTGTIPAVILQFAYFFITLYMNILYIIRGITIAFLLAFAPFFIICMAFPGKVRGITEAWISELIGNYLIQIVHILVLSFLMSVNVGLRGIEAIVFCAVLIPLTNLIKSLFTKGGGLTSKLAGTLTAGGTQLTASAANMATDTISSTANGLANGVSGITGSVAGGVAGGIAGGVAGATMSRNYQGGSAGSNMISSGVGATKFSAGSSAGSTTFKPERVNEINMAVAKNGGITPTSGVANASVSRSSTFGRSAAFLAAKGVSGANSVFNAAKGVTEMGMGAGMFVGLAGIEPTAGMVGTQIMNKGGQSVVREGEKAGNLMGRQIASVGNYIDEQKDADFIAGNNMFDDKNIDSDNKVQIRDTGDGGSLVAYKPGGFDVNNVSLMNNKEQIAYQIKAVDKPDYLTPQENARYSSDKYGRFNNLTQIYNKKASGEEYKSDLKQMGFTDIQKSTYKDANGKEINTYSLLAPNSMNFDSVGLSNKNSVVGKTSLNSEMIKQQDSSVRKISSYVMDTNDNGNTQTKST